jgi:hypothetical protein
MDIIQILLPQKKKFVHLVIAPVRLAVLEGKIIVYFVNQD